MLPNACILLFSLFVTSLSTINLLNLTFPHQHPTLNLWLKELQVSVCMILPLSAGIILYAAFCLINYGGIKFVANRMHAPVVESPSTLPAEHQIDGLEPVIVAAIPFPTMKFNSEAFSSMEDAQCTICLTEYQDKEVLRIMPKCGHSFHLSCMDTWLRKQPTCPVCRLSLQDFVETKHVPSASLSASQSHDSSDITFEHSHQWLLPNAASADGSRSSRLHSDSVPVQLDNGVARESALRSS